MKRQFLIADSRKFNAYPTGPTNIRRPVKLVRTRFDERRLNTDGGWYHYGDVSIAVMVNGAHGKDFLTNEEGWFPVGELFHRLW